MSRVQDVVRDNYLEMRFFSGFDQSEQGVIRGFGPIDQGLKTLTAFPASPTTAPYLLVTDPVPHPSGDMTTRLFLFRYGN